MNRLSVVLDTPPERSEQALCSARYSSGAVSEQALCSARYSSGAGVNRLSVVLDAPPEQ